MSMHMELFPVLIQSLQKLAQILLPQLSTMMNFLRDCQLTQYSGSVQLLCRLYQKMLQLILHEANPARAEDGDHIRRMPMKYSIHGGLFLCGLAVSCMTNTPSHQHASNVINKATSGPIIYYRGASTSASVNMARDGILVEPQADTFICENINNAFLWGKESPADTETTEQKEMFLPGLIIHIVAEKRGNTAPLWKICLQNGGEVAHKAYVSSRENFKDIVVTPYMFLDHLPWRCLYAMQSVLATQKSQVQHQDHLIGGEEDLV